MAQMDRDHQDLARLLFERARRLRGVRRRPRARPGRSSTRRSGDDPCRLHPARAQHLAQPAVVDRAPQARRRAGRAHLHLRARARPADRRVHLRLHARARRRAPAAAVGDDPARARHRQPLGPAVDVRAAGEHARLPARRRRGRPARAPRLPRRPADPVGRDRRRARPARQRRGEGQRGRRRRRAERSGAQADPRGREIAGADERRRSASHRSSALRRRSQGIRGGGPRTRLGPRPY